MKSNVVNFVMCFLIAMMLSLAGCGGSSDGIIPPDPPVTPTGKFTTNELTAHTIYASEFPNFNPANTTFGSITAYTFNSNGTVTEAINMTTTSTSSASKILSGTYTIDSSGVVIVSIEIPLKKTEKLIKMTSIADAYNSIMVESNYDTGTGTVTVISRWFFDVTQGSNQALAFAQGKSIPDLLTPTISSFTPASGPTGSSFTISGTNFSTIAAQNTVKINGINAIVTNATSSQLVVTVPSGATTGPVSVTVGSTTVTSSSNFTVTQPLLAPMVTGVVKNPLTNTPVSGAAVKAFAPSSVVPFSTVQTDSNGNYSFSNSLYVGTTYYFVISINGFGDYTVQNILPTLSPVYLETVRLIPVANLTQTATISGTISRSSNGLGAQGLTVKLRAGAGNQTGTVLQTTTTTSAGLYTFSTVPGGVYSVEASGILGTITITPTYYTAICVPSNNSLNANQNFAVNDGSLTSSTYRMVLTWGATPSDLDSHITGPNTTSGRFHVYFSDKDYPLARL